MIMSKDSLEIEEGTDRQTDRGEGQTERDRQTETENAMRHSQSN